MDEYENDPDETLEKKKRKAATKKRYRTSLKGRETALRYSRSESRKKYLHDYWRSKKGRAVSRRNNQLESVRQSKLRWIKNKYRTDHLFRLKDRLSCAVRQSVRRQRSYKNNRTVDLLGCSIESFKIYLESLFEPGMSWENHGRGRGKTVWHIDHIIPCALFDLSKIEHQKRCFHFSNLQPLWAEENLRKSNKVVV